MSDERQPADLLRERTKIERRLLRVEQAAERDLIAIQERLAAAELKFEKAQARVDRHNKRYAAAIEALQAAQLTRAIGPETRFNATFDSEPSAMSAPAESAASSESQAMPVVPERDDTVRPPRVGESELADDDEPSDPRPTRRRKRRSETPDPT